jgi:hypothetical protein
MCQRQDQVNSCMIRRESRARFFRQMFIQVDVNLRCSKMG